MMRVGIGFDVHAFSSAPGPIHLGGVEIPSDYGILAHSDGDVLLHAICDALLGALALGDIGEHFPDTDPQYRGVDSQYLLREVKKKVLAEQFEIINIDATLIAEAPKVSNYKQRMRESIATCLGIDVAQVSVKATTTEQLGAMGRREGIAAQAIACIHSIMRM